MNFYKRLFTTLVVGAVSIGAFAFGVSAYGADNDIVYSFTVPGYPNAGYSKAEYRGNSGTNVPWKVNFRASAEGSGTVMYYYLSGPWWSKESDYKAVKESSGNKYYHAYDTAKNMNVALAAKNNNNTPKSFLVSGYWDEETAKHTFSDYN